MAKAKGKAKNDASPEENKKLKAEKAEQERLKKLAILEAEQKALVEKYNRDIRENNIRDFILLETIKSFDSMRHGNQKLQAKRLIQQKWDDYVSCVNLPSGSDAPELRAFLQAWQAELKQIFKAHISWTIDINERSLLTQDRSVENMCRKKLWSDQSYIGDQFIGRMRKAYRLIHDMDTVIHSTHLPFLKSELIETREKYRKQMKFTIDLFAYRLLIHIERDMTSIDPHKARHNYESELFRSAVWTSRPVPQIGKHWLIETSYLVEFPLFQSSLLCPGNVEMDGYSFRSLWTNYDHFSDTAPSYNLKVGEHHVFDLRVANRADWSKMQELREAKLEEMIRVRAIWEEAEIKRIADEAAAAKAKKNNKDQQVPKKRTKKAKMPPEPPPANKDTIVTIDAEFQDYDEEQYSKLHEMTSPHTLDLAENEVNLRDLYMLGGIFEFNHLKRPVQFNQIFDNMLLRLDDGIVLEYRDYDFNPTYQSGSNASSFFDDLIEITVRLSDKVCWWTTPIVACWEPWEKSDEFLNLSPELKDFHLNYDENVDKIRNRLFAQPSIKINTSLVKCVQDFKVDEFPHDIGFVEFIKFYLIPRIPLSYKFKSELDQEREILRKENLRRKEVEMEHAEEKLRKKRVFDDEMRVYKEAADVERIKMIETTRAEMEEERELTRIKLLNQGENDKQIEKHLKFKESTDEKILNDMNMDAIIKYNEFYSEQYDLRFNADSKSEESVVVHRTIAAKTLPSDLYPPYLDQLPLRISMPQHKSICFDCPTIEDNAEIIVDENADSDQMMLSTFLQYLKILYQKSLPYFRKHKLIGNRASINTSVDEVPQKLNSSSLMVLDAKQKSIKAKGKGKGKGKSNKLAAKSDTIKRDESKSIVEDRPSTDRASTEKPVRIKPPPMQLIPHAAGRWMTSGIYFTEFDPKSGYIKYKTSHLGPFGFGMPRYCNYPLKYWEMYPNLTKKASVYIKIIGNFCEVKLEITEDGYYIERILPNKINFEPITNPMTYEALTRFLSDAGIINFPQIDSDHYINGVAEKHFALYLDFVAFLKL